MKKISTFLGGLAVLTALTGYAVTPSESVKGMQQLPADVEMDNNVHLRAVGARVKVPARAPEGGYTVPVTFVPTQEQFNETLILDNNEDGKSWTLNDGAYRFNYSMSNAADDWAILPGVAMEPGVYKISATYYTKSNKESFAIKFGNARTPEAMTTTLVEQVEYSNTTPVTETFPVEITAAGEYYVGLYAYSEKNRFYIYVKNITIEKVDLALPKPVVINSVVADAYDVTVDYTVPSQTVGGETITEDLAVTVMVDDVAVGDPVVTAPGANVKKELTITRGNHKISITAALGDKVSEAASYAIKITKKQPVPLPIPFYFAPDEDEFSWCKVYNVNDDTSTWAYSESGDPENSPTFRYSYSMSYAADDWIITPGIGCEKGKVYEVSFKVATKYEVEGLEVAVGYGDKPADMTIPVYKDENLKTSNSFEVKSGKFYVGDAGYIHLGIHAISAKNRSYIYVKNISIVETNGNQPMQPEFTTSFDGGDGTVTVTAPEFNIGNQAISGEVTLALYIDDELAGSANVAAGASHDFAVTGLDRGNHKVKATASVTVNDEVIVSEPIVGDLLIGRPSSFAYDVPVTFAMNSTDFDEYLVIDGNADGSTWEASPTVADGLRYRYNMSNQGDDWLLTEGVRLEPGITYNLAIDVRCYGSSYQEAMDIFMGTERTAAGMTTLILDEPEISNADFMEKTAEFTVEEAGKYYFGIHAKSEHNKYYLYVKNMSITAPSLGAPGPVTDFDVDPDINGEYKATVYFTMPLVARDGSDLPAEESLTATVTGSNTQVVEGLPGEAMEVEIETVKGSSIVTVVVSNSFGESNVASMEVVCGLANPSAPQLTGAVVSDDNMSVALEWSAVVTGTSEGVLNPVAIRYRIFEWDEEDEDWYLIDDVKETHYTVTVEAGAPLHAYVYGIDAYNSVSTSSSMTEVTFVLGTPYELPVKETFADNKLNYLPLMFSSSLASDYAPTWAFRYASTAVAAAGQVPALIGTTDWSRGDSRLLLPKVSTVGAEVATFSVKIYVNGISTPKYTALVANAQSTEYTILGECDMTGLSGWQEFKFALPESMLGCQWISPVLYCNFEHGSVDKALVGGYAITPDDGAGVDDVVADGDESEAVYYNLQGIRVDEPANGLYIKKQGGQAVKVIVK